MVLSTFLHSGSKNEMTEVPSKYPNKLLIKKLNVVLEYAVLIGGVHCIGHVFAALPVHREDEKWYEKNVLLSSGSEHSNFILNCMSQFRNDTVKRPVIYEILAWGFFLQGFLLPGFGLSPDVLIDEPHISLPHQGSVHGLKQH
jgi:hypothetical protein